MTKFERDGRSLLTCILDLTAETLPTRAAAAKRITMMEWGVPHEQAGLMDMDSSESQAFKNAVREVFDDPAFPSKKMLRRLVQQYNAIEPEECSEAWRRSVRGKERPDASVLSAISSILPCVGSAALAILPELIQMIEREPSGTAASLAAEVIASIGPDVAAASAALFAGLREAGDDALMESEGKTHWNPFVRALAGIAKNNDSLVEDLIRMVRDGRGDARAGALVTLQEIGPQAMAAKPLLLELMDGRQGAGRAIEALAAIDPLGDAESNSVLFSQLTTCDEYDRRELVNRLRELGFSDSAIADEISKAPFEQPEDESDEWDEDDDDACCEEDGLLETETSIDMSKPLADLVRDLLSEDSSVCRIAANTIAQLNMGVVPGGEDDSKKNSERFKQALKDLFLEASFPTVEVLGGIIDRLESAHRGFQERVTRSRSTGWIVEHEAMTLGLHLSYVVENCGPGGAVVLQRFADLLRNDTADGGLSRVAAEAMKSIGSAAASITDAMLDNILTHAIREWPNPRYEFVGQHGLSERQLQRVTQIVGAGKGERLLSAIEVLKVLGSRASAATDVLKRAMDSADPAARCSAVAAFAAVVGDDPAVVAELLVRTHDVNGDTRMEAARALGELRAASDSIVDRLFELTRDEWYIRGSAISALGRIGKRPDDVLALAIEMLDDFEGADWNASECAVEAIGALGSRGAPAVPQLIAMLDTEEGTDDNVVMALGAMGSAAIAALDRLRILRMYPYGRREEIEAAIRAIIGK